MKLSDFVCMDAIVPSLDVSDRDEVITKLVESLVHAGKIAPSDCNEIANLVIKRENEASTGIGKGVAVPHAKVKGLDDVIASVGCSSEGIDFSSLDKNPVYSVILLLSPDGKSEKHLQAMEAIFSNLQKEDFRKFLRQATSVDDVRDVITEADESPPV